MSDLLHRHCQALEGGNPMSDAEIAQHLKLVSGWRQEDQSIQKTFAFKNYHETIAFVNALAWICHAQDHHPELVVSYNRCIVTFDTHSVGGVSINDFICAAKADNLIAFTG
jgi:4a-hydroxytetrahydrobiopterin dehydratase